jgi:hypothetical protein
VLQINIHPGEEKRERERERESRRRKSKNQNQRPGTRWRHSKEKESSLLVWKIGFGWWGVKVGKDHRMGNL